MSENTRRILVAGGGIGGLATALGLAKKGYSVLVLEKAPRLGEIGAGIQLAPNAFHSFDYLGIGDAARKIAVYVDAIRFMDAVTAKEITHLDFDDAFRVRFKNPYAVVHRADLHSVLLAGCRANAEIDLKVSSEVVGYHQDAQSVTVRVADGTTFIGAGLIGADGLWSNVRKQLAGDSPPRLAGHTTYRSVIPYDEMPEELRWNAVTFWAGPMCHLVHYPISDLRVFNLAVTCHNNPPAPAAAVPATKAEVLKGFAHVHPKARKIIDIGKDWKYWVLADRDPIDNWVDRRVGLLGDAAHPMLQHMAQGACMALEDAVCLSHMVGEFSDRWEHALKSYHARRLLRVTRVQVQSRVVADHIYHPNGAHAALRNAMLGAMSQQDWWNTMEWLYAGTGLHEGNFR
jgi:3-hydroxybenzoate 6-monooxygenase